MATHHARCERFARLKMMFGNDGPETPDAELIRAVIMQAYRDLFISVRADGSSSFTTQADQDQAISFLTDKAGGIAKHRNALCSLINCNGDALADRVRGMMEGDDFPSPAPDPTDASMARHMEAVERVRERWRQIRSIH